MEQPEKRQAQKPNIATYRFSINQISHLEWPSGDHFSPAKPIKERSARDKCFWGLRHLTLSLSMGRWLRARELVPALHTRNYTYDK